MKNQPALTRREALKTLSAGTLLALGLWPGALEAANFGWGNHRNFKFIVVNDLHYMDDECGRWLEGAVQQMKSHNAKICLVVGDLADDGKQEHLDAARDILHGLGIPFFPVIGNHDHLTQTDANEYETIFPSKLNYHFDLHGWQFIGLDSSEGLLYQNTSIQPPTLRWLDEHLPRLSKRKPTVLFTHFPLGADVRYRPVNADALLARFRDFNLQAVYSGHYHASTERNLGKTLLTTGRCCALKRPNHDGTKEKGYVVCSINDGAIHREFVDYKG